MIDIKGISLNSNAGKQYFSIFVMVSDGDYRHARTIYFPTVDTVKAFLHNVSNELQCTVEEITFAPHINLELVGIMK